MIDKNAASSVLIAYSTTTAIILFGVAVFFRRYGGAPDKKSVQSGAISFFVATMVMGSGVRVAAMALGSDLSVAVGQPIGVTLLGLLVGAVSEEFCRSIGLWSGKTIDRGIYSILWFGFGYGCGELLFLLYGAISAGMMIYAGEDVENLLIKTTSPFLAVFVGGGERLAAFFMQLDYTLAAALCILRRKYYFLPMIPLVHAGCNWVVIFSDSSGLFALQIVLAAFLVGSFATLVALVRKASCYVA